MLMLQGMCTSRHLVAANKAGIVAKNLIAFKVGG